MDSYERWDEGSGERIERLAAFPELNPNPVIGLGGREVVYANPAALASFPGLLEKGEEHPVVSCSERVASELRGSGSSAGSDEIEVGGTYYHLDVYLVPDTVSVHVYATDVTERIETRSLLVDSERRFRQLFDHSTEAIFIHDTSGRIVDCNAEACLSLGYSREELLSLSVEDFVMDMLSERERGQREDTLWTQAVRTGPDAQISFHKNLHRRKDGSTFPVEVGIGAMDYGGERLVMASARDISGRRLLESELAYYTHHDALTGLPNRRMLDTLLKRAVPAARRRGERLAVMFLHVGGLDKARERLSYQAGDLLLYAAAQRIRGCLGLEDTVCRVGDALAVLAVSVGDEEQAVQTVSDILEDLGPPLEEGDLRADTTVGVALVPDDEPENDPSGDSLSEAYDAMCQARRQGDSYNVAY